MIEKVMKAVKRNSKRRSVNITIGAVVGFLLSCTAVMGAAAVEIKVSGEDFAPNKVIEGNTFDEDTKTYTNNGEITGEDIGISVDGKPANIKLSIINNGSIEATATGIELNQFNMKGNITNNGTISGKNGINIKDPQLTGDIINNGNIESNNGHGIQISQGTTNGNIVNNGIITTESGYNLYLSGTLKGNIINKGMLINNSNAAISLGGAITGDTQNDGFISVSSENTSTGIEMSSGTLTGNIYNTGAIETESTATGDSSGILVKGTVTGNIENTGTISSATVNSDTAMGSGINIGSAATIGGIKNDGIINTSSEGSHTRGIYVAGTLTENMENNGVINSTAGRFAYGMLISTTGTGTGTMKNAGIINSTSNEDKTIGDRGSSNGIYISNNLTGNIENTGTINSVNTGTGNSLGIYNNGGTITGNIENNGVINSSSTSNQSYGISNNGTVRGNIENNGIINTTSATTYSHGIYNSNRISDLKNRGLIATVGANRSTTIGISIPGAIDKILNTGYINSINTSTTIGITTSGTGIINEIINKGNINTKTKGDIRGIDIWNTPTAGTSILNEGIAKGTESGLGAVILIATAPTSRNDVKVSNLTNSGVLYGAKGVISLQKQASGSITLEDGRNYGILAHKTGDILNATGGASLSFTSDENIAKNQIANYGLAFTVNENETYTLQNTVGTDIKDTEGRNIVNAQTITDVARDGAVTGTTSIEFGDLDSGESYILNGIDNTLKVTEKGNKLNNSIVNAYKTAMVMENGAELTAEGTAFNSVDDDSPTISLAGNNTVNLSKESIVNGNMEINGGNNTLDMSESNVNGKMAAEGNSNNLTIADSYLNDELAITGSNNTLDMSKSSMNGKIAATGDNNKLIIAESGINDELAVTGKNNTIDITDSNLNKNIAIDGENNTLTIAGENTFINGDMKATEDGNNTVKLAGKSNDGSSLNMFNNISGFENMNITGGNVTFFENAEVTGVKNLTVEDGTLNLRLKKVEGEAVDGLEKGGHAFSNNGEMVMTGLGDGGTLQFITNGIGEGVWIDTSDMQIKNMVIATNSVLDKYKFDEDGNLILKAVDNLGDMNSSGDKITDSKDPTGDGSGGGSDDGPGDGNIGDSNIFDKENFDSIDGIYKGIVSSTNKNDNLNAVRDLAMTDRNTGEFDGEMSKEEQLKNLQAYLNEIYTQSPYALSSELSRRSAGMFRDIVTENMFRPNLNQWMIMGGLTHIDGGTKDTYYGEVYQLDGKNSLNTEADMKLTGAYALGKYGYSENIALGVTVGGNRSEAELSKSKVKGNSGYIGAFAENYRGNLTLKAGAGIQYSEYDADRSTVGGHSYNDKYSDMTYDIYLNGRYSNPVGENLFLEPYATLSYTYVDQDGTDEGSKALAIKTDSKSFEYTSAEVGVDLKKVIPHEKGKSTLSAGVSYTRLLNGADSDKLTGNFGGSDFDILVAGKNKHNLGLNAKYTLELESGVLFDVKGSYSFERDSHKDNARNRNKGEWMVGAGLGYKF